MKYSFQYPSVCVGWIWNEAGHSADRHLLEKAIQRQLKLGDEMVFKQILTVFMSNSYV